MMNQTNKNYQLITISNFISLARIFLMIPIVYLFRLNTSESKVYLLILMLLAIFTDYLDGFLARKLNQVSEWGKIFDPVADKICIGILAVLLIIYRDLPLWFVIIVLSRDLLILLAGLFILDKKKCIMQSSLVGKLTTFFLSVTILAYTFEVELVKFYLLIISTLMIICTVVHYTKRFLRVIYQPEIVKTKAKIDQPKVVEQSHTTEEFYENKMKTSKTESSYQS